MSNPFNTIPLVRPRRSVQNLTESHRTTANIGEAIVSYKRELVPGDTFYMSQIGSVEFMPTVAPFKGELWLESCAFFVPYDMVSMDDDPGSFSEILLSMRDVQESVPIPKWHLDNVVEDTKIGSLWDYCNFPTDLTDKLDDKLMPLAYLQRAYNHIFNEYIRDEFIDDEISLNNNKIQTVCYKKDLFTSASKEPQLGEAPKMKLKGSAFAKWTEEILGQIGGYVSTLQDISMTSGSGARHVSEGTPVNASLASGTTAPVTAPTTSGSISGAGVVTDLGIKVDSKLLEILNNNEIDLSNLITFNIEDLRVLNRLQKWLERNAMVGARYKEYLIANYGIAPSDETLDRPAFIGRVRTPIMINSVINTSETTEANLGHKAGNAVGVNGGNFGKYLAKEFGVVVVLSWIRPKAQYSQGVDRQWIKDSVYDFFNPIFEGLGMQPVLKGELFANGSKEDLSILGYSDRYNDMRTAHDQVSGYLRGNGEFTLKQWSVQRVFSEHPTLSSEFLHVDSKDYDYLFALDRSQHPEAPQAVLSFTTTVKAIRPIHKYNSVHF